MFKSSTKLNQSASAVGANSKPADLVRMAADAVAVLANRTAESATSAEAASEELSKCVSAMKSVLYGDVDGKPVPGSEEAAGRLSHEWVERRLLQPLVAHLSQLSFECKKDVAACVNGLVRTSGTAAGTPGELVEHIAATPAVLELLLDGYESSSDVALACGSMLRECVRHEPLAALVLNGERVWRFFQYVEFAHFEVASDALATFGELLTTHRELVFAFLTTHFERFFGAYRELLRSPNYVTRRQTLKLLGDVIVHRRNFAVMSQYIGGKLDLMIMMNLLRDKSKSIQFEAFHVFKVFVANPNKPDDIVQLLRRNKERLTAFLATFRADLDDEQFKREKAYLLKALAAL